MNELSTFGPEIGAARTFLFVPGDRPDRFPKAAVSGADEVICDLEDSVAPSAKSAARENTVAWLTSTGQACVRINAPNTLWHADDVAALAGIGGLRAVIVPKAEDPDVLAYISRALADRVPLVALVESAVGVLRAREIAGVASVTRLAFGSLDFTVDVGAEDSQLPLLHARSHLVLCSRAGGLAPPVDGITTAVIDHEAVSRDARHAVALGFSGKLCIHPGQVPVIHEALRPSHEELAWAREVLDSANAGVGVVAGQMVDRPVVDRARIILRRHRGPGQ